LCAQWCVLAWKKVPEELVIKAWELAGYKTVDEIEKSHASISWMVVSPNDDVIRSTVEQAAGADAVAHLFDPENSSGTSTNSTSKDQNFEGTWNVEA
jgi:hypothetical protein